MLTEADFELCKNSLLFATKSNIQDCRDLRTGVGSDAPNRGYCEHGGICETSYAVPVLGASGPQVLVQRVEQVDVVREEDVRTGVEDDNLYIRILHDLVYESVEFPEEGITLDIKGGSEKVARQ